MELTVRLFASHAAAAGRREATVTLDAPATVATLRAALATVLPEPAAALVRGALVAVNARYAPDSLVLGVMDEIALIPPVTGG